MDIKVIPQSQLDEELAKYMKNEVIFYQYDWLLSKEALHFSQLLNGSKFGEECEQVLKVQGWHKEATNGHKG